MSSTTPSQRGEPPDGSPWDDAVAAAPFALVDLEMTGLDARRDRVIEICIERRRGGRVEGRLESLVRPRPRTVFRTHVHGIDRSMLRHAPPFDGLVDGVLELLHGAVPVAHGAAWDMAFLEAELARTGRAARIDFFLDTLTLSRRAIFAESHSLHALAARLGIERRAPHRAADDVRVLSELFVRLLCELRPGTPRDLWHVRVGHHEARPDVLAACVALAGTQKEAEIQHRPSHRAPRRIACVITGVRTDLDPPRVMGYALPDRGRFDLRADRILWAGPRPDPRSDTEAP